MRSPCVMFVAAVCIVLRLWFWFFFFRPMTFMTPTRNWGKHLWFKHPIIVNWYNSQFYPLKGTICPPFQKRSTPGSIRLANRGIGVTFIHPWDLMHCTAYNTYHKGNQEGIFTANHDIKHPGLLKQVVLTPLHPSIIIKYLELGVWVRN